MAKNNNNQIHNPEVINLADVLGAPVAGNVQEPQYFNFDADSTIEDAQFDETPEPEVIEAHQMDAGDFMPPQALAETIVNSMDGLQTLILPILREKKVFSAKEREMLEGINKNSMYGMDTPEAKLIEKHNRHLKIVEKIPFTAGEQKRLKASFATYIKLTDMKVTPLQGLMMSLGEVMLTRATYFMNE